MYFSEILSGLAQITEGSVHFQLGSLLREVSPAELEWEEDCYEEPTIKRNVLRTIVRKWTASQRGAHNDIRLHAVGDRYEAPAGTTRYEIYGWGGQEILKLLQGPYPWAWFD